MRVLVIGALLGGVLGSGLAIGAASATSICAEPIRPFCIDESQRSEGDLSQQRCAAMLARYIEELGNYVDCMKASVTASETEHSKMQERLACMREGEKDCR